MATKPARFYVDDRPDEGVFRVHRDVCSGPEIFELEMKYIFERTWNFLTIEESLPMSVSNGALMAIGKDLLSREAMYLDEKR
jgi:hypothetical protein